MIFPCRSACLQTKIEPSAEMPLPLNNVPVNARKRNVEMLLCGIWGPGRPGPLIPQSKTATGAATVTLQVLK